MYAVENEDHAVYGNKYIKYISRDAEKSIKIMSANQLNGISLSHNGMDV